MGKFRGIKQLLTNNMIDFEDLGNAIAITNLPVMIKGDGEGNYWMHGCGFSGKFEYSAEFLVNVLDKKFREDMKTARPPKAVLKCECNISGMCATCGKYVDVTYNYCKNCGCEIDWEARSDVWLKDNVEA